LVNHCADTIFYFNNSKSRFLLLKFTKKSHLFFTPPLISLKMGVFGLQIESSKQKKCRFIWPFQFDALLLRRKQIGADWI